MSKVPVSIMLDEDALKVIDKGAKKDLRTRSGFLEVAGVEKAKKLLIESGDDLFED